ncbi:hypothetical protein ACEU6E_00880 [Halorutilales archaeon Cl-col2-1]
MSYIERLRDKPINIAYVGVAVFFINHVFEVFLSEYVSYALMGIALLLFAYGVYGNISTSSPRDDPSA